MQDSSPRKILKAQKQITARSWERKSLVLHKRTLLVLFVQVTPRAVPSFEAPAQIRCHYFLLPKVLSQHMPLNLEKGEGKQCETQLKVNKLSVKHIIHFQAIQLV